MNILSKKYIGYVLTAMIAMLFLAPLLLAPTMASAQALEADDLFKGTIGDQDSFAGGEGFAADAGLQSGDLVGTISNIIRVALGFLGIIAVIIILLGGFKWMTAGGNDDKVKDAKKLIFSGIIGLVIVLSAFAIANFVISTFITSLA